MFDSLFALLVLAFILVTALVSISQHARSCRMDSGSSGSILLGGNVRSWYIHHLQPFEERCIDYGVQPSHLSLAQLAAGFVVAFCYARGMLFTAGWLMLVSGSLDIIDGRLARRTQTGSRRGAFLDSVVDRYADAAAFMGLAVYFRESWLLWACLLGLIGGLMVSYTRARAEGLGADCKVGLLQRPERYVLLGFGSIFSTLFDHVAGTQTTHPIQRSVHAWRLLGASPDGTL